MDSGLLISGLTFIFVMLAGFLAFNYSNLYQKKKDIMARIRKEAAREQDEASPAGREWKEIILRSISRFGEILKPKQETEVSQTRKKLVRAGYYGENGAVVFFGSKIFAALFLFLLALVLKLAVFKAMQAQLFLMLMVFFTAAGFYLPDFFVSRKTAARKRKIFEGFPDALDLMVVCVEAGMGLDAAIKRVGDEMALKNKVLSDEFRMLSLELRAGKSRADALRNLASRTDLEDVSSLATLLIQTDRFGTRIAQALRVHSDAMRTKRYQRAEEMAAKLPVKMVLPLIFFIFPSLFVAIIGPAVISIYRNIIKH
ncbi:MAG TPA: type II secretion system F family protein [Nitrospirota bacterium]